MIIRSFNVKNFMIHRKTSVSLHPITVLVGPNNGGKSALFDALTNFSMVSRGRISQAFSPGPHSYREKRSKAAARAERVSYEVGLSRTWQDTEVLTYTVSYSQSRDVDPPSYLIYDEKLQLADGTVLFDRADLEASPLTTAIPHLTEDRGILAALRAAKFQGEHEEDYSLVTHVAREVSRVGKFRLNPQFLAQPSRLPDVPADASAAIPPDEATPGTRQMQSLDYRGDGLATVLYFMTETASPVLDDIVAKLRTRVEGFDGFEFNTVGADRVGFSVRFTDARGIVSAANLSDGTLSLIGLTVLLANPSRLPILCIEEPENGLTPRSTQALYADIREVAFPDAGTPASQVLLSSHSPHVITEAWNGLDRDFIYVVRPDRGRAVITAFSDLVAKHGIMLEKDLKGERTRLNLSVANQVMDGYYT